jgi:hypothetical protein
VTASWNSLTRVLRIMTVSELFPGSKQVRSAVERSWTRSNAALISIARGEGAGAGGVGEGGASDEVENEVRESLEWVVR